MGAILSLQTKKVEKIRNKTVEYLLERNETMEFHNFWSFGTFEKTEFHGSDPCPILILLRIRSPKRSNLLI